MNLIADFYPETDFGGFTSIDGTMAFYSRLQSIVRPEHIVLDLGCGRGAAIMEDKVPIRKNLRTLRGKCSKVIGLDVDPQAKINPFIDEFHILAADGKLPLANASIDICYSDYVLEHVKNPDLFFSEISRVLKPGGYLAIRTTNQWNYIALAARIIKPSLHLMVLKRAQPDRDAKDTFPAFYRCNSIRKIKNQFRKNQFKGYVRGFESEPRYLSFSKIAFVLGYLYQKLSPSWLGSSLFAFAKKKESQK